MKMRREAKKRLIREMWRDKAKKQARRDPVEAVGLHHENLWP